MVSSSRGLCLLCQDLNEGVNGLCETDFLEEQNYRSNRLVRSQKVFPVWRDWQTGLRIRHQWPCREMAASGVVNHR